MFDALGDLLLKPGVALVKGDDVACGSKQCYTVNADLSAATTWGRPRRVDRVGSIGSLPIDLSGATVKLTMQVEKDLPNHLAGVTAVITTPSNGIASQLDADDLEMGPAGAIDGAAGRPGQAGRRRGHRTSRAGRVSRPTYNGGVSPTRRRRTGDPTLDDAAAAAPAPGTAFTDLAEAAPATPEEPAWMRDAPAEARTRPRPPRRSTRPPSRRASRHARSRSSGRSTRSRRARSPRPTGRC